MHAEDPTSQSMRTGRALTAGVTAGRLRGPGWTRPIRGVVRPADAIGDPDLLRIGDARALLGDGHVLGGWGSLRFQGNTWFTGHDRDVPIHCLPGAQLRRRPGVLPTEGLLHPDEVLDLAGCRVTTIARAAYDEMRTARSLHDAVVVHDMATSTTSGVPHCSADAIARVLAAHHKTRGIVQARRAASLGSTRSASPWETRVRLIAQLDVGLTRLDVNRPIFDDAGTLLGVVDLLDVSSGLVIESDGAHHRDAASHAEDNRREEALERAGLVVCRVTALDHQDRSRLVARIAAAHRHALRSRSGGGWTTDPPAWWWAWPPARRWA